MAGWGKANQDRSDLGSFEEFGVFERTAMIAELGVIDRDECRQKVGQNVHAERQFCAGGELGEIPILPQAGQDIRLIISLTGVDSCSGDSGGPLYRKISGGGKSDPMILAGIVSYGTTVCGIEVMIYLPT